MTGRFPAADASRVRSSGSLVTIRSPGLASSTTVASMGSLVPVLASRAPAGRLVPEQVRGVICGFGGCRIASFCRVSGGGEGMAEVFPVRAFAGDLQCVDALIPAGTIALGRYSRERLSRHWIDVRRAYHYRADPDRALDAILKAERIAVPPVVTKCLSARPGQPRPLDRGAGSPPQASARSRGSCPHHPEWSARVSRRQLHQRRQR